MSAFALYAPNPSNSSAAVGIPDSLDPLSSTSCSSASPHSSDNSSSHEPPLPPLSSPKRKHSITTTVSRYPSMSECDQSIVAASALVGENVLDSPTSRRMTKSFRDDDDDDNDDYSIVDHDDTNGGSRYSDSRVRSIIDAANVGVIASGWAWVKRQRARRQREYLQHQAQVQLQKIAEAQEAEGTLRTPSRGLEQNVIYQQLTRTTNELVEDVGEEKCSQDYPLDQSTNSGVKVTSASISKSGLGISVSVEVPSTWQDDDHHGDGGDTGGVWIPQVRLVDDNENLFSYPFILTHEQMQEIATSVLPLGISHCLWKRLYSLARDGDSFEACLRLVGNEPRSLLVLRTTRGVIFGGFADSPWEMTNQQVSGFHGSAQACLYTFFNNHQQHGTTTGATTTASNREDDPNGSLVVYKWTGANRYFQLVSLERKMMAFGGGGDEGSFGLCIEQDFQLGSTGCCDTFGNQPLCDQENFSIVDMEIWSFVTGRF